MTHALSEKGHKVTFVLPRLKAGMSDESHVELIGVSQFPARSVEFRNAPENIEKEIRRIADGVRIETVETLLSSPYMSDSEYHQLMDEQRGIAERLREGSALEGGPTESYNLEVTGEYGPNLLTEIVRYARVAGAIARSAPHDVIHAHDWLTMLAGVEAKRVSGKPLVVHVHATEFDRSGENVNQVVYDIERLGMERADKVVAVSHYTKDIIVRRYGIPATKVEVVHNAVTRIRNGEESAAQLARREKVVLFLGRITFQKGPDYFVEAAAKVLRHRKDVRFVMAGSGDMAPRMIERVAELKLGRRFHFTGFLNGAAVEQMFRESDIYVMPSVSEPFGISPLEAMAYDVPVIISKQSGVAEVLRHALKVDFWDVSELASKIIALLDHGPLRQELVEQGAKELENIQWGNAARKLGAVYEQISRVA
jgi:glycosyltransferase involved in cell wall biosynthesis